ncbi:MAG: hypothetical protein HGA75_15780 [Thiobacillus sp.]|nr:hypothetical protein [Thiobacillus sp.]
MRIRQSAALLCLALSLAGTGSWADTVTGDQGGDMLVDLVVLRPLGFATTVVGGALFVLGLPFTLPSGTVAESACELVQRPAAYTFARPLGDLEGCDGPDCKVCAQKPAAAGRD